MVNIMIITGYGIIISEYDVIISISWQQNCKMEHFSVSIYDYIFQIHIIWSGYFIIRKI